MNRILALGLLSLSSACHYQGNDVIGEECEYERGYSSSSDTCAPGYTCADYYYDPVRTPPGSYRTRIPEVFTGRCRMLCEVDSDCVSGCLCASELENETGRTNKVCRTAFPGCEPGACGRRPGACGDTIDCGPCPDAGS